MYTLHPTHLSNDADPFVVYSRSLHDYTLKLWTESIRMSEERSRGRAQGKDAQTKGSSSGKGQSRNAV